MGTKRQVSRPRANIAATLGSLLLVGGAAITGIALVLPHPSAMDERGYLALMAAMLVGAGVSWAARRSARDGWVPWVIVCAAIGVVTMSVFFNGERHGGPPIGNEIYYLWPALYVGYFFRRWAMAFALVLIAAAYGAGLVALDVSMNAGITRWVNTVTVASGVAVAVHALRVNVDTLLDRLRRLARSDALTGVLNRRGFDERFEFELERAARSGQSLAVVIGDIDRFKQLNDALGHAEGDLALQRVADAARRSVRVVDAVARIGGEEFALLLPGSDATHAYQVAERIRATLAEVPGAPTISFGVAAGTVPGTDGASLMARADSALYEAKEAGRDRTVVLGQQDDQNDDENQGPDSDVHPVPPSFNSMAVSGRVEG